jgi:hypothetical protein
MNANYRPERDDHGRPVSGDTNRLFVFASGGGSFDFRIGTDCYLAGRFATSIGVMVPDA